jgi:hypothetical protein
LRYTTFVELPTPPPHVALYGNDGGDDDGSGGRMRGMLPICCDDTGDDIDDGTPQLLDLPILSW